MLNLLYNPDGHNSVLMLNKYCFIFPFLFPKRKWTGSLVQNAKIFSKIKKISSGVVV